MKKILIPALLLLMIGWAGYTFFFSAEEEQVAQEGTGLKVGDVAPDFELTTLSGEAVKLEDYRGKRVFVNFWATWCPPCREEMPDMQKLYDETDVEILAVNMTASENSKAGVSKFIDDNAFSFPVPVDPEGRVTDLYEVRAYPTSYLIDSEGRIAHIALGAMDYERMLDETEKMQ